MAALLAAGCGRESPPARETQADTLPGVVPSPGVKSETGSAAPSAQVGESAEAGTSEEPAPSAQAGTSGPDSVRRAVGSSPDAGPLTGMYLYLADAARFSDCATGISYPVAQEGAAATLERAYLDARGGPGEPVFVTIRGRVATRPGMEGGPEDAVVIDSVESVSPDRGCGGNVPDRPLADTQWVLTEVVAAPPIPGGARAMLRIDPEQQHISGSTGCNAYSGTYRLAGGQLDIALTGVTRRGCAPALARLEADFLEALRVTGSYRVRGDTLELLGEAGVVARFAAGS